MKSKNDEVGQPCRPHLLSARTASTIGNARPAQGSARSTLDQVIRYAFVGTVVALIYLVIFYCVQAVGQMSPVVSSSLAFLLAVMVQYVAHAAVTFRRPLRDRTQAVRFASTIAMGLAFSVLVMGYLAPSWGVRDDLAALIVVAAVPGSTDCAASGLGSPSRLIAWRPVVHTGETQ